MSLDDLTVAVSNSKPPRPILPDIFAFGPNRDTLGSTSYFILEDGNNILLDCPPWHSDHQEFLNSHGGVRYLVLTHRGAISKDLAKIQQAFHCPILIQEQEAYLLPQLEVISFTASYLLSPTIEFIWTPGHSPGASCLYLHSQGGILFSGRHLLPAPDGQLLPLKTAKTFHWPRQLQSVELLRDRFSHETLQYLCPGANLGFLRGKRFFDQAYQHLLAINLDSEIGRGALR